MFLLALVGENGRENEPGGKTGKDGDPDASFALMLKRVFAPDDD